VTTPFDALAPSYNVLWTDSARGREQREAVWREIDGLFRAGDRVLDLGCGPGDDALHLAGLGVDVLGIDAAPRMVEIARRRGVNAHLLDFSGGTGHRLLWPVSSRLKDRRQNPIACPTATAVGLSTRFSGAISNFGALNCVADLRPLAAQLACLIQPAGPIAICVMGRFCLTDWRHAPKRWIGHTRWRGMDVYYPTSRQIRTAFAPGFAFERRVAIGRGDHQLYIFRRRAAC